MATFWEKFGDYILDTRKCSCDSVSKPRGCAVNEKPVDLVTVAARLSALEAFAAELSRIGTHGDNDRRVRLQELENWATRAREVSGHDLSVEPLVVAYRAAVLGLMSLVRSRLA